VVIRLTALLPRNGIAGLDPAIHFSAARAKHIQPWIAGSSPAMTVMGDAA
jgi:hypothetical protein